LAAIALVLAMRHVIFDLVIAVFLALVLNAPVAWLQTRRISRGWAILIVSLVVFIAVAGVTASIAAPLATQGTDVARHGPQYLKQAEEGRGPLGRLAKRLHLEHQLRDAVPAVSRSLSNLSSHLVDFGRGIASAAARTAIILVLTIFMLVEGPRVVDAVETAIPPDSRAAAARIGRHASASVSSYTLGILLLAALNGIVTAAALAVMRVPFVLALAMWAGVVDILPIIGGLLAILVVALFAFGKGITAGIVVVAVMVVYQQVKNHVLYPVVVGRAVRLNALIVLVAVLAGAELAKIPGAILAIPVAAVIHVAITEFLGPRIPWLAEEAPAERELAATESRRPEDSTQAL
jgi:predicted PurR-regulated permease PerM